MDTEKNEQTELFQNIENEIALNGGESKGDVNSENADGMTMFDLPGSQDNLITVLLPKSNIRNIGAHSMVEIRSRSTENGGDGRIYRGIVVAGPFHEPDGIRADAHMLVTTTIHGSIFMPNYHGKVQVELIGEISHGMIMPPRFRPLPNSPVFVLSKEETAEALRVNANPGITLGLAIGHDDIEVKIPAKEKTVIPRHIGILGTTGGGKSTTISGLMSQFQKEGIATIVIDTEGEYTHVDKPTESSNMQKLLKVRGISSNGIQNINVMHLIGKKTRAKSPTTISAFRLDFSSLSPYAASDILGLTEAQFGRFFKAYDAAKLILKDIGSYPNRDQQNEAMELDEFETGWPTLTLSIIIDVSGMILDKLNGKPLNPFNPSLKNNLQKVTDRINAVDTNNEISWAALLGKLWQLSRTKVFDNQSAAAIPFSELIEPGKLTIIDLSDSDSPMINNIVIANLLRGVQLAQEEAYEKAVAQNLSPTPVSIIIEEAHEFLSKERIGKMSNLFQQVARIARRGRKRWLGLVFVTQLPQHLPDEVLGLVNSFILHKIGDSNVVSQLKRSIGGVDQSLWNRLPNLAPGQAIVTTPSLSRSLLVAIDPSPCKLLMVD
ncbi:ATP-binding protein [Flavobacterium sp. WW92]|uniref:ATP-binding protein n=1 Tax=unclassified Flavobacterium TaxID=196869 RepID=UPI00222457A9|nr:MULTISPECIES: ATP-binding protein [unclassified Flavobacterium]WDO13954.1 ATP-binding protein [Flavobacterium sp. WW92]